MKSSLSFINLKQQILDAKKRIESYIFETPLIPALQLSAMLDANVLLKLENLQSTGAFKIRGAFNKLLSLTPEQKQMGIVAASTGNHGAAVAYACRTLEIKNIIFMPEQASPLKVNNVKNFGGYIEFHGRECGETERIARDHAKQKNMVYISPYNDIDVMTGQGTIAVEIMQQQKDIDVILACVGGGGLIGGIAAYAKQVNPKIHIIGCLPENSPVMYESIKANKILELDTKPTLSDATAGNMDLDSITFDVCKSFVDDYILASEQEIKNAICLCIEKEHLLVEGAVGVSIASVIKQKQQFKHKNVAVVISGANISLETLNKVISGNV